jgi:hypothetical protein
LKIKLYDIENGTNKNIRIFSCENQTIDSCVASIKYIHVTWEKESEINFFVDNMNCNYDISTEQVDCEKDESSDGIKLFNARVVKINEAKKYEKENQEIEKIMSENKEFKKMNTKLYGKRSCMVPRDENINRKIIICESDKIIGGDSGGYWYNNIIYFNDDEPILAYRSRSSFVNYFWYQNNFYFIPYKGNEKSFELKKIIFK